MVTSPPYNCGKDYGVHNDSMPSDQYLALIQSVMKSCVASMLDGRFMAWNVGVTPASLHFEHAVSLSRSGLMFWRQIVWEKVGVAFPIWQYTTAVRKFHPNYCHEVIYLFTKGSPSHGEPISPDGDERSRDVWRVHQSQATVDLPGVSNARRPRVKEHGGFKQAEHPAAYPITLPRDLIWFLTNEGEVVLDPFSGSGTTIMACEMSRRRGVGVEINPRYVDAAIRRWQATTGRHATLGPDGPTWDQVKAERLGSVPAASAAPVSA